MTTIALLDGETAKVCRVCGELKALDQYHKNKSCKLGVEGTCRICSSVRIRGWYAARRKERQQAANTRNRERKAAWVKRFGGVCFDCKGSFPDVCFDFHHVGGKDMNPSKALTLSEKKQEEELSKCVLLCSNCHRLRHFGMEVT